MNQQNAILVLIVVVLYVCKTNNRNPPKKLSLSKAFSIEKFILNQFSRHALFLKTYPPPVESLRIKLNLEKYPPLAENV